MKASETRRGFLASAGAVAAIVILPPGLWALSARHHHAAGPHPTPRKGITGAKVAKREDLPADSPAIVALFDAVRQIPAVLDGIRCNCGCSTTPGFYSLLSCYEGDAMAVDCKICQGQGRLVVRLNKSGKSLDQIREAVDAQFG